MKNLIQKTFCVVTILFFLIGIISCRNAENNDVQQNNSANYKLPKSENAFELNAEKNSASKENQPTPNPVSQPNNIGNLEEIVEKLKIGDTEIRVVSYKKSKQNPLYFRPHENESTASEATKKTLVKYGGRLVELQQKGERFIDFSLQGKTHSFDPNRIFSAEGIKKTLGKTDKNQTEAEKEVAKFVDTLFSKFLTHNNLIIAVHNNTDEKPLSVESYKNSPEVSLININPNQDADDFFYLTNKGHFMYLKERGFNVVLQDTAKVTDDGSLSVYCGKRGIDYINVESENGHIQQQIEMLEAIQELINRDNKTN